MNQVHSPALDRLIRRQRVSGGEPGAVPDAAAAGAADSSSSSSQASSSPAAPAAATTTTTTQAAQTTTTTTQSPAPSTTTTTTTTSVPSSSSLVPASSSTTTTTTTPAQASSSAAPSSSSTTTTTSAAPATSSTTSTTTSSTTVRDTTSQEQQQDTAFSTSARTTVVIVSGSASSGTASGSGALASSTAGASGTSTSIGTGGVIGIVAGAVVGVVFVAAVVAFLFKKYARKHDDDDQISPFDKDEFRRASVMLDDDVDAYPESAYHNDRGGGLGHSPQMSEYSMTNVGIGAVLPGLARGQTLHNPRPPTAILNHYQHQHQQMMPSFQPGQVIPTSSSPPHGSYSFANSNPSPPLGGTYAPMDPYAYPQLPHPAAQQPFAPDQTGGLSTAAAGHWNGVAPPMMQHPADLSRNNSQLSSYSQYSEPRQLVRQGGGSSSMSHGGHPDERPLSLVHEDDEPYSPSHAGSFSRQQQTEYIPERSGTPTNSNVQQTFFGAQGVTTAETGNDWEEEAERDHRERQRRLSIRNGGLDQFDDRDDPYDGMH
ncbi:hypothetical protein JCM11491_005674 [Sporobolomyces phaffii]